jgi:lipoyl(octanoyl) transferase
VDTRLLPLQPGGLQAGTLEGRIPQADYLGYLQRLETTLVQALGHIGVRAHTIPGHTGVWVNQPEQATGALTPAKVADIGVKVGANGVSHHGFALNINPDMEAWQGIIPCGIENCRVTCLAELLSTCPDMRLVCKRVMESFAQVFNFELRIV